MQKPIELRDFLELPASTLRELSEALHSGTLRYGISTGLLTPYMGGIANVYAPLLRSLIESGCSTNALAAIFMALHAAKGRVEQCDNDFYLTLSGPDIPSIPVVDTPTVVRSLFEEARQEVLVASYVFMNAQELLAPLAEKMKEDPTFRVRFVVDLSHQRKQHDEPLPIIANRFKSHFLRTFWNGIRAPEFWHDPRAFHPGDSRNAGVMHAKFVIIDRAAALVTSANFTEAAQNRNIEAGVIFRSTHQVGRLRDYFDGLIATGNLVQVQ